MSRLLFGLLALCTLLSAAQPGSAQDLGAQPQPQPRWASQALAKASAHARQGATAERLPGRLLARKGKGAAGGIAGRLLAREGKGAAGAAGVHRQMTDATQYQGPMYPPDAAILMGVFAAWEQSGCNLQLYGGYESGDYEPFRWNASWPCESWAGVTCGASGRVTGLNLGSGSFLVCGSFLSSLTGLSGLQYLDLSSSSLDGSIPTSIGSLTGLQQLNLYRTGLSGSIPSTIGHLTALQSLNLGANDLSGSIPSSIGSLSRLYDINLSGNELSGPLPSSIGSLTGLQTLTASYNNLSGSIPSSIGSLTALSVFWMDNNRLTGPLPSSIDSLTGLASSSTSYHKLDLSNNFLSGSCASVPPSSALAGNCFRNCSAVDYTARDNAECSLACGSDQAPGPCLGRGTCFITGSNNVATCACNPGYVSPASNAGACGLNLPPPPPGYVAKLCAGMVSDPKKCKCPPWARCQRKSFCYNNYVCRCVGVKRRPVTDPKTGLLTACI